jgi:hypothetical protein
MRRRLAALALLAAGCTQSGTGVELTVDGPGLQPNLLTLIASFGTRAVPRTVETTGLPTVLLAELPDADTSVTFDVTAKQDAAILAHGVTPVIDVSAHHIVPVSITLVGPSDGDGGAGDGPVATTPWTAKQGGEPLGPGTVTGLWGPSGSDVYATSTLATGTNLLRSVDHGATWQAQLAGSMVDLHGVTGSSSTDVILVGGNATVLRGSGTSWTQDMVPIGATTTLFGVFEVAPGDAYAVGSGNTAMHYQAGWILQTTVGTTELHAVWGVSGNVWAVGGGGTILHTTGTTWSPETSGVTSSLNGVFGTSATDIWAVGDGAVVLHSTGNGTWTPMASGIPSDRSLSAVTVAPGGTLFVAGTAFSVYRLASGVFINEPTPLSVVDPAADRLFALFAPSSVEAFAGGAGRTLLHRP